MRKLRQGWELDPSLRLYLPLYELDGQSFRSRDAYGHLCTVTGAKRGFNWWEFDGVDDVITIPHSSAHLFSNVTVIAWVNYNGGETNPYICFKHKGTAAILSFLLYFSVWSY